MTAANAFPTISGDGARLMAELMELESVEDSLETHPEDSSIKNGIPSAEARDPIVSKDFLGSKDIIATSSSFSTAWHNELKLQYCE